MGRAKALAALREQWGAPRSRARNLNTIAEYHRARAAEGASLDDRTWADLDLDAVFATIDHTTSTIGQQALYDRLRTAPVAPRLAGFGALTDRMATDTSSRERAQLALVRLQHPAGYDLWWLAQPGAIESKPWHVLFPALALAVAAALLLMFYWPGAIVVVAAAAVTNLVIRAATATRVAAVLGAFRQIGPLLAAAEGLAFLWDAEDTITAPLQDDLPRLGRLRSVARWVSRDPMAGGELLGSIFEYLNLLFLLDANALFFAGRELEAQGPGLLRVLAAVGEIDAAISTASVRAGAGRWTRPAFGEPGTAATFTGIRHPLLAEAVPNTIALAPPHGVLVTGSNMSGKSTFLRTVGVTTVLAQTLNTCSADAYDAPVYHVRTCIGRSDDLQAGKSYYIAEVEAVLGLVRASEVTAPHLFLFDELFRGTNAIERIAAGEAVLAQLLAPQGASSPHVVIAATHDGELVDLLRGLYASFHFTDRMESEGLVFDYMLKAGPATTRNAIALLQLYGAPNPLVARAMARAEQLTTERADRARR